jgi:hypothetical protein
MTDMVVEKRGVAYDEQRTAQPTITNSVSWFVCNRIYQSVTSLSENSAEVLKSISKTGEAGGACDWLSIS